MNTLLKSEPFISEKLDIILLIGQSNAEGFGLGEVAAPYEPTEKIMQLVNTAPVYLEVTDKDEKILHIEAPSSYKTETAFETVHKERGILGCLALPFAKKYLDKYVSDPERRVLVVKAAVGSSGFLRENWCIGEPLYKRAVEMTDLALSLNPENRLVAVLWHEGESDAIEGRRRGGYDFLYPYYRKQLSALISDLRNRYGEAPFIAGGLCPEWTPGIRETSDAVENATRDVLAEFPLTAVADSEGLISNNSAVHNGDSIHFARASLYELANRYFELFEKMR